ncbi:MAG: carbohydrate ABC transporter permease, partial [Treponema sp.]|nr:carbohydrate ABC transporter permease [Candidatus Treponema equifaecale]
MENTAPKTTKKKKNEYNYKIQVKSNTVHVMMIILALIAIVPVWVMLINATRNTEEINAGLSLLPSTHLWDNLHILTSRDFKIWRGFLNSTIISGAATVLTVYFSALTAYGIHVYNFKGKKIFQSIIMVLIMLPASLSFIGFYQFVSKLHLTDSYIPLIVPSIAAAGTVLFMKQYMDSILSSEIIEAARIDGAHEFKIFNIVILP